VRPANNVYPGTGPLHHRPLSARACMLRAALTHVLSGSSVSTLLGGHIKLLVPASMLMWVGDRWEYDRTRPMAIVESVAKGVPGRQSLRARTSKH
jgi:hypothetical protein